MKSSAMPQPVQPLSASRSPYPYPRRPFDESRGTQPSKRTSVWALQHGGRQLTKDDLARDPQSVAVTGDIRDGLAGALVDASHEMESVD